MVFPDIDEHGAVVETTIIPAVWEPEPVEGERLVRLAMVLLLIVTVGEPDGILIPRIAKTAVVAPVLSARILLATVVLPMRLFAMVTVAVLLANIPLQGQATPLIVIPPILLF